MKIHIVQKGDTLWKIAKHYGVDFNELKNMNTQLSNPEMIMPGMKIKVPSGSKQVKHQTGTSGGTAKEKGLMKKEEAPPLKAMPVVPKPIIEEDDEKPMTEMKPQMPIYQMPQAPKESVYMPKIEFDLVQNSITQQSQQAPPVPQVPIMPQLPEKETPQPIIQILPVYFYPIMQPAPQAQVWHNPCEPCNPCSQGYQAPVSYATGFEPNFHDHQMHAVHAHGHGAYMHDPNGFGGFNYPYSPCDREEEQSNPDTDNTEQANNYNERAAENTERHGDPSSGQSNANNANNANNSYQNAPVQPQAPNNHTYYDAAPRYFGEENLYSPGTYNADNNFAQPSHAQNNRANSDNQQN